MRIVRSNGILHAVRRRKPIIQMMEHPDVREPATTSLSFQGSQVTTRVMPALGAPQGGDWCEVFALSEYIIALSIGDVCGHGVEKHNVMADVRQVIRSLAHKGLNPAQMLYEANRFLCRYDGQEYATGIIALLDTRLQSLTYANAGHPAPVMADPCKVAFLQALNSDLPLGVTSFSMPILHEVHVPVGSLVVFYTDGVTEHDRKPLQGAIELYDAVLYAYQCSGLPTAGVIEERMCLSESNCDDAAIMTLFTPRA